jgi:phospholipid/cholesterol/gamma-HCH transport system substrate-binding protein
VEGLEKSAAVTINGLTIGKVSAVTLDNDTAKITVELQINTDFPIKEGSIAEIYAPSPIGGKQIAIIPATSGNLVPDGGQLVAATKLGLTEEIARQIEPLKVKVLKLLDNTNAMMENINQVMDASTKENLRQSLAHLDAMLIEFQKAGALTNAMLAENQKNIKGTLANADKASANFVKISEDLAKANWTETVAKLDETLKNVNLLLQQMEAGKGTMGKLMKDEQLYANFTKTSKELELLLQDLRLNPTRYVNVSLFGKKNKPYVAPVADTIKK